MRIRMIHTAVARSLALLALAPPGPASAAGPVAASALQNELDWLRAESVSITTASMLSESREQAPATVQVVTRRNVHDRGYGNLLDVLNDLPAVDVQRNSHTWQYNIVALRGIGQNYKFRILEDGVNIGSADGTVDVQIADNFALYNVKQVEILYGPASAIYGADAFAGVINLITRSPKETHGVEGRVEVGEFGQFNASFHSGTVVRPWLRFNLGGHYQEADNPDLSRDYPGDFKLTDLVTFDGRTIVRANDRRGYHAPTKSYSTYAKVELGDQITLGWKQSLFTFPSWTGDLPNAVNYGAAAQGAHSLVSVYGTYRFALSDQLTGDVTANYSRNELNPDSKFVNIFSGFDDAFKYERGERYEVLPKLTLELSKQAIIVGLTGQWFSVIPFTADLPQPYDRSRGPGQQRLFYPGSNNSLPVRFFDIHYSNVGAFVQDKIACTDRLSLTLGVRDDYNSDYGNTLNPRAGLVFQADNKTTLKASYGEAFLAPAPIFRFINFGAFTGAKNAAGLYESFFFRVPNPALDPEKMRTAELSVSHRPVPELTLTASGFRTSVSNVILVTPTIPVQSNFVPGGVIFFTDHHENIGHQTATGFELSADYLRSLGDVRVNFWGSFSYVTGELENRRTHVTVDLPFVAREKTKAGLTLNYRDEWIVTPSAEWIGRTSPFVGVPTDGQFGEKIPGYSLVNLYVERRHIWRRVSAYLRVTNLLDKQYYNVGAGDASFAFLKAPQDGRWIRAGMRLEF